MKPASVLITPTTRSGGAPGRAIGEGGAAAALAAARLGRLLGRADDDATGGDGGGGAPAALADEVRRVMAILYMGFLVRGSGWKDAWAARLSLFMDSFTRESTAVTCQSHSKPTNHKLLKRNNLLCTQLLLMVV